MTNNPAAVKVTQADKRAADEILRCLDATVNDHSYDELLLILAEHRIAAEKRRQDVTALYAYEAGFEGAESVLRQHAEKLCEALCEARAALNFHYTEWDGEPEDAVPLQLARSKCDQALADYRKDNPKEVV